MPRPVLLGASFAVGIIAGILGTALHGNIWVIGDVESGLVLPWGALLSLLLLLMLVLWAGTTEGSLTAPTLLGASAFTVATAAYVWPGPDQLVVPFSPLAFDTLPGPVIASLVWWLGSAGITLVGLIAVRWILTADAARTRQRAAGADR